MRSHHRTAALLNMVLSCVICSIAVNWIALPNGFVVTGITGLAMTAETFTGINYALIYYGLTLAILLFTAVTLGYKEVSSILFLSILYPLVLWVLNHVQVEIILKEKLIAVMFFGVVYGAGAGLTYRMGYSYGGTDTLSKILKQKVFKAAELKNLLLCLDAVIMLIMLSAFSLDTVAYAFVGQIIYVNSMNYVIFNMGPRLYEIQIVCEDPRAIQEIEEGKRVAQSRCSPTRGQVRLGFISAVSATLIPWCVSHFYQNPDNQGITFTFDEKPTRRIAADLTHHALDIGFGTRFDDSSFEFCPVVPEELVAVVPAGHPLAQQEQVTLEQLSRERLVIYNQASPTRNLVLSMFRQQDLQPDVAFEVATDHMLASFVSQGLGVGIMPRMFGLRLYSVRPLYIADTETHRMLYMFRPKDRRVLPAVQRFWDFVLEVCAQYQSDE